MSPTLMTWSLLPALWTRADWFHTFIVNNQQISLNTLHIVLKRGLPSSLNILNLNTCQSVMIFMVSVKTAAGHVSAPHGKHPKVFLKVPTPSASEALLLLSVEITWGGISNRLFYQKDVSSCIRLAALLCKPHHSATYEAELFNPDLFWFIGFKWSLERKKTL